ncbi:unnamed protein product [Closterium sp. NIES-64]|nr:unnamed protein product [Closterium sp. NIES-64]
MLDIAISVLDPRLAQQASSSQPTPRSAARYRQVHLSFASPPPDTQKRARCVPPPPTAEELEAQDNAIAEDAEVPPDTEIPEVERSLARCFSTSWKQTYSWLSLKYNKHERQYGMKCSVCYKFAPNTKSPFGGAGVGARDFQKSACRNHDQSNVHIAAMEAERLYEGTEFVEAMAEHLVAKQLEDIKESAWYSLSFDESTNRARGKHLIVYVTFERAEAVVSQFLALLSLERCNAAALHDTIVKCLWSKNMLLDKLVGVSTDGASVMTGAKNGVVAMLRKRCSWLVAIHYVDITEVKNHVDKVKTKLSQYYVKPGASNGPHTSHLNKFLAAHGSKDKRKMELKGVDENGKHAKAEIELHEDIIDPENPKGGCDLEACVDLARRFAQRLIKALGKRMANLRHFDGVGFFSPDKYPDRAGDQDAWVKLHLSELLDMFKNKLPGKTRGVE